MCYLKKSLNRDIVKLLAVFAMLSNHVGNLFFAPGTVVFVVLTDIGYFTAPVMCFMLVDGYNHTRSVGRYFLRLFVFAVLSEIPYFVAFGHTGNMLFTLCICLGVLYVFDYFAGSVLCSLAVSVLVVLSVFFDWSVFAPLFVLCLYMYGCDDRCKLCSFSSLAACYALYCAYIYSPIDSPVLLVFHSVGAFFAVFLAGIASVSCLSDSAVVSRRSPFNKWFFYAFYPLHLVLLVLFRWLLFG